MFDFQTVEGLLVQWLRFSTVFLRYSR